MDTKGKRYAIFLDIDGTLMGKDDRALQRNLDVIQKVRSLGHKVLINTGRATAYLPKNMNFAQSFDGVVSGAGARVILEGKEVFCKPVGIDAIRRFCEFCIDVENVCILEGIEKMYFVGPQMELDYTWKCISHENMDEYVKEDLKIEKFTVLGTAPKELYGVMGEDYLTIQHGSYAEIIQKGITKAGAMKFVLDVLGLPIEQSIAMGDSLNDFDMIENAGIGVAMGNAVEEIKNIADIVTEHVDEAGVASALEKIFSL